MIAKVSPSPLVGEVITQVVTGKQRLRRLPSWMTAYSVTAPSLRVSAS
ncbi:transposase domain-containing protein [Glutamicibacter sp. NPDC127525]